MAGKTHALLSRRYTKRARPLRSFLYVTRPDRPSPNFELLRNALAQTGWKGPEVGPHHLEQDSSRAIDFVWDWPAVVRDVEPFLEDPRDRQLLDREMLLSELRRRKSRAARHDEGLKEGSGPLTTVWQPLQPAAQAVLFPPTAWRFGE